LILARYWVRQSKPATNTAVITDAGYINSTACAGCHREIWARFARTGMGRSMRPASAAVMPAGFRKNQSFYHKASDRHYSLFERNGKFYQHRHQTGPGAREINIFEQEIHYVVGSGNHAKTFLHRNPDGRLMELPLAWYAEGGGSWAMNPGYDHPNHPDFRREIPQECMFCHNAYPALTAAADRAGSEPIFPAEIPAGIDCQRCHGPGREHVQLAAGGDKDKIRKAILNPARLSPERQLDICMQCHLETTSARLPGSIVRWDRGVFSFRPGEPLGNYTIYFDHPPGSERENKFEIASHAYRFRKSACFTKSSGRLTCTTCHSPHDPPSREQAIQACRACHASVNQAAGHPKALDCVACHMQKRRTEDVVHVVMTDHFIQRIPPPGDPLAPRRERAESDDDAYRGPVVLYYPSPLEQGRDLELYLAVAQVKQFSNLSEGVPRLIKLVEQLKPASALVYLELAKACDRLGQRADAVRYYQDAVDRDPELRPARLGLAQALAKNGSFSQAAEVLQSAVKKDPNDAPAWNSLGLTELQRGQRSEAVAAFRRAVEVQPEYPEAYNNLAGALAQTGDRIRAAEMYQAALRLQPDLTGAHLGLAALAQNFEDAEYHFKAAVFYRANDAHAHYEYGIGLASNERYREAAREFEAAVRLDPVLAEAHASLGDMLSILNEPTRAIPHYRRALELRPELESARTGLEMATRPRR
jgi:tetratricopeptide (TPR) repeat protein